MKNALTKKREILSIHRGLLGKFPNIRACDERFLARASKDQDPDARVITRIQQCALQFFDSFAIQCVQNFRPIERDSCDAVVFLELNIFVAHCALLAQLFSRRNYSFCATGFCGSL